MQRADALNVTTATNFIRTALQLWLLDTGNSEVPRHTRALGLILIPSAPHLQFSVRGDTNLSYGFVRVWDGHQAWSAPIRKGCMTGKAHKTP